MKTILKTDAANNSICQELVGVAKVWRSPFALRRMSAIEKRKWLAQSLQCIRDRMNVEPSEFKRVELDVIAAQLEAALVDLAPRVAVLNTSRKVR